MREVADVAVEERAPAGGIDRLEHDRRARAQGVGRCRQEAEQVVGLQVLDDLRRDEAAEAAGRRGQQERQAIGFGHGEAPGPAALDHLVVLIHAARRDTSAAQQREELATAAADVHDIGRAREDRDVVGHAAADLVLAAAKEILEAGVLLTLQRIAGQHLLAGVGGRTRGARCRRDRRRQIGRRRRGQAPRQRAAHRQRVLLHDRERRRQVGEPRVVALVAAVQRVVALQHLVRQPAQAGGESARHVVEARQRHLGVFGRARGQAGKLVVLRVQVRRQGLQVDHQRRLEVRRLLDVPLHEADGRADRLGDRALAGHAAVQVIDERRVEALLRGQ